MLFRVCIANYKVFFVIFDEMFLSCALRTMSYLNFDYPFGWIFFKVYILHLFSLKKNCGRRFLTRKTMS